MDDMMQAYMEETEDMLQSAEECIIRLEMEYSDVDVNELFRIAHTIKGSSYMVGYEDIGELMHKIEDMLDCARNGSILFDQSIVSLCFEGLDTVKNMLKYKNQKVSEEIIECILNAASRIKEMMEVFIQVNKKEEEKTVIEAPELGVISSCLSKKAKGKNKYYITFFFEEDAPMVSPVILMILNYVQDIGTLIYSSIDDNYFLESSCDNYIKTFDIIISTDINEAELYTYFALFYIERINIVDLSRSKVKKKDYNFIDNDHILYLVVLKAFMKLYKIAFSLSKEFKINKEDIDTMMSLHDQTICEFSKIKNEKIINNFITDFNGLYSQVIKIYEGEVDVDQEICTSFQTQLINVMERCYNNVKGKHIVNIFKLECNSSISRLKNFIGMLNKSLTLILLIDLSKLTILHENEVKDFIEVKKQLESQEIEVGIIVHGPHARRIINIFDSIKQVEEFNVFESERHAILGVFDCEKSFYRISKKVKDV